MEVLQDANYESMSLDDVIRDMKAKKALEEGHVEDNSPFLRQQTNYQFNRRPLKTAIAPRNYNRSNYLNHMAKKRLLQARKTLDLRQRLITIRANKAGLDLRWKIVANMIFKLRQQAQQSRQRFHPYPQLENSHGPRASPFGHCGGMVSQPKVSRSTLSQIERLVGKLPSWMKPNAAAVVQRAPSLPHSQHNHSPTGVFPMRAIPRVFSPQKCSHAVPMQQTCFAVPNHAHSCCQATQIVPNHYHQTDIPRNDCEMPPLACEIHPFSNGMPPLANGMPSLSNEMPPLAYEPSPRTRLPVTGIASRIGIIKTMPHSEEEDIHINVLDSGDDLPPMRKTLNERFTQ